MPRERPESRETRESSSSSTDGQAVHEQNYESDTPDRDEQFGNDTSDLLLDVPVLKVDEIDLEIKNLRAHVSLNAEVADLVKINVGVDAFLEEAKLGIKGLEAQVLLKVNLERVLGTLNRALEAIGNDPQILGRSAQRAGQEATQETEWAAGLTGDTAEQAGGETERANDTPGREDEDADEVEATDAARRKARELGVRLSIVEGTGSGGRVLVRDVEKAAG